MPNITTALRALTTLLTILAAPLAAAQDYAPLDTPLAIRQVPGAPFFFCFGCLGVSGLVF